MAAKVNAFNTLLSNEKRLCLHTTATALIVRLIVSLRFVRWSRVIARPTLMMCDPFTAARPPYRAVTNEHTHQSESVGDLYDVPFEIFSNRGIIRRLVFRYFETPEISSNVRTTAGNGKRDGPFFSSAERSLCLDERSQRWHSDIGSRDKRVT